MTLLNMSFSSRIKMYTSRSFLLFSIVVDCFRESTGSAPFGPPYPITAAWFQDRFSKTEWNKTLTEFKTIGGDTVLLRAPAMKLRMEQDLEQDPEFQVGPFARN